MPVLERSAMPSQQQYIASELERYPYLFKCDNPSCYGSLACESIEAGIVLEQRHTCGEKIMKQPRHVTEYLVTKGGIATMWSTMDSTFDRFRGLDAGHPEKEYLKNTLSGMAEILFIAMKPYFENRDEIVKEVVARATARDNGTEHHTKGFGWIAISPQDGGTPWEHSYSSSGYTSDPRAMADPPDGYPKHLIAEYRMRAGDQKEQADSKRASSASKASTYKPPASLTPDKIAEIKERKTLGFDDKMLCAAYQIKTRDLSWALEQ